MRVVIFRNRLRSDVDPQVYGRHAEAMYLLAQSMPGFLSSQDFVSSDGERLSIITFQDDETLAAWRNHPQHRAAQEQGRREYYQSYDLTICDVLREVHFP